MAFFPVVYKSLRTLFHLVFHCSWSGLPHLVWAGKVKCGEGQVRARVIAYRVLKVVSVILPLPPLCFVLGNKSVAKQGLDPNFFRKINLRLICNYPRVTKQKLFKYLKGG